MKLNFWGSLMLLTVLLANTGVASAKRLGKGSSSDSHAPAKNVDEAKTNRGGVAARASGDSSTSSSSSGPAAGRVAAGVVAGAAGGAIARNAGKSGATAEATQLSPDEEARRLEKQLAFDRAAAAEEAERNSVKSRAESERQRAVTERERQNKLAALDAQRRSDVEEQKRRQAAWEARCIIKPVMTDAELATCKEVRTKPTP